MTKETITDFVNMCVVHQIGSEYQFILTNSYSRVSYVLKVSRLLFDKSMESKMIWDEKPYKVSELKPKIPEMTS